MVELTRTFGNENDREDNDVVLQALARVFGD